jgi:hypothetical protein
MEDLVAEKIVELIANRSELSTVKHELVNCNSRIDGLKKKAADLQKMVHDLNLVIGKYVTDAKKDPEAAVPFKITRSVGLQVSSVLIRTMFIGSG